MSPYGTKPTFASPRLKVCSPPHCRRSGLNVGSSPVTRPESEQSRMHVHDPTRTFDLFAVPAQRRRATGWRDGHDQTIRATECRAAWSATNARPLPPRGPAPSLCLCYTGTALGCFRPGALAAVEPTPPLARLDAHLADIPTAGLGAATRPHPPRQGVRPDPSAPMPASGRMGRRRGILILCRPRYVCAGALSPSSPLLERIHMGPHIYMAWEAVGVRSSSPEDG